MAEMAGVFQVKDVRFSISLYTMLIERKTEILEKCRAKVADVAGPRSSAYPFEAAFPLLYDELIEVLRLSLADHSAEARKKFVSDTVNASSSRAHAQQSFRMGYTVSQLVHGYGSICQGITEFAYEQGEPITSTEFSQLNMCLDVAIAQAVSEFELVKIHAMSDSDTLRMGFLVHEVRNYLSSAMLAHELIKSGDVGANGATSQAMTMSLQHIKQLVDRAIAEVRMNGGAVLEQARLRLFGLLSEIEGTALAEARAKSITLNVSIDPSLEILADGHLISSAVSNLVQNAIKFTPEGGAIWLRAFSRGDRAIIEIEDRCGGLPLGKIEHLFEPYVQHQTNRGGMGLGLPISRRAVELNGGSVSARDIPGVGCVFSVDLPLSLAAT